jgi:hypothetical protein
VAGLPITLIQFIELKGGDRMPIRHVTADFAVHEQLQIAEIETIAKAGFKTVICNRPDDEAGYWHLVLLVG